MANPLPVICEADVWTIVAESVTAGQVKKLKNGPMYLETYRMAGEEPPTEREEGVPIFINTYAETISAAAAIDVYIMAIASQGKVRVDLP